MKDRKCTFQIQVEEAGNKVKKTVSGMCKSEPFLKKSKDSEFFVNFCEGDDGQMYEAFTNTIKFVK